MSRIASHFNNLWGGIHRNTFDHKISQQYEVFVIDNLTNEKSRLNGEIIEAKRVTLFQQDIRDKEKITEIIRDCRSESCVHLAEPLSVFPNQ